MAERRTQAELDKDAVSFADLLKQSANQKPTTSQDFLAEQQKRVIQPSNATVDYGRGGERETPRTPSQNEVAEAQNQMRYRKPLPASEHKKDER
jgi:hypothetical protein